MVTKRAPEDDYDASPFVPPQAGIRELRAGVEDCRGCPLYRDTFHGVFGSGRLSSSLMLVGEQPGDQEDREGTPFVGPAGRVLDECMTDAGVDRAMTYVTNAVKHFKHRQAGQRRIHQRPTTEEINACHPWLDAELALVRPERIVALGAVGARSLLERTVSIGKVHGEVLTSLLLDAPVRVTYHPSAALRHPEAAGRQQLRDAITETLALAIA